MNFAHPVTARLCSMSQIVREMVRINTKLTKLVRSVYLGAGHLSQESPLFRTFSFGVIFGLIGTAVLLYFVPAVDQVRERSIITVQANVGNNEFFHINLPIDRVLAGRADAENPVPPGLDWPDDDFLAGAQAEIFKVRNAEERVIGVASRIVGGGEQPFVEWAVHMPARGTMYILLPNNANEAGIRYGDLRAGTREFATLNGSVTERYIALDAAENNGVNGRLELVMSLVSPLNIYTTEEGGD